MAPTSLSISSKIQGLSRRIGGGGPPLLWTPANVATGRVDWYDFSDAASIALNGALIAAIANKFGSGSASQGAAALQPVAAGGLIAGRQAAGFTGDLLTNTAHSLQSSQWMVFWLGTMSVSSANYGRALSLQSAGDADDFLNPASVIPLLRNATSAAAGMYRGSQEGPYEAISYDQPFLLFTGSDGTQRLVGRDGNLTPVAIPDARGAVSAEILRIGQGVAGEAWNGLYGEIVVLSGYDLAIRQRVEGYLAHRWGLAAALPATHPFKDAAPTV